MKATEYQPNIKDSQETCKQHRNQMFEKNDNNLAKSSYQQISDKPQKHVLNSQTINKEAYLEQRITKLQTIIKWFQQRENHKDEYLQGEKQTINNNHNWQDHQQNTKRKSPKMFKYSQFAYENRDRDFDYKAKTQRKGLQHNNRVFSLSKLKLQSTTVNFSFKDKLVAKKNQIEEITFLRKKIQNLEEENRKLQEENCKSKNFGSIRQKVDEETSKIKLNEDKTTKNRFRGHIRKQTQTGNDKNQLTTSKIYSKKHQYGSQSLSSKNIRIKKSDYRERHKQEERYKQDQRRQTEMSKQHTERVGLKHTQRDILIPQKNSFLNEFHQQITSKELVQIKLQNIKYDFSQSDLQIDFPQLPPTPRTNYNQNMLSQLAQTVFALFDIDVNRQNVLKIMKFKNGVIFHINNEKNIVWQYDGKFFIGNWWVDTINHTCGEKNGRGIEFVPNQYIYEGDFKDNSRHGKGKMKIFSKNQFYNGQWYEGQRHGYGVQIHGNYIYEGGWRNGKKHGVGRVTSKMSKYLFEGTFIKGKKNGSGSQLFETEDYYTGQYLDDNFHGKGTYIWKVGAIYEGDFLMGLRHGRGIWKSQRTVGDSYEGQYKNNMKNGYGIYKWEDGSQYHGYFKDDMQHGQGKLIPTSGQAISCIWHEGRAVQTKQGSKIHFNIKLSKSLPRNKTKSRQKSARISNSKFF